MSWRRTALGALLVAVVLIVAVVLAALWASRSDWVLRWAIAQAAQRIPGELTTQGVRGSLTEPVTIEQLRYVDRGMLIDARRVGVRWSPWRLLFDRQLAIQELQIEQLTVRLAPAPKSEGKPQLPDSLAIPVGIAIDHIAVNHLNIETAGKRVVVAPLLASYSGGESEHRLRVERLATEGAIANADLRMSARRPYQLTGVLQVQGEQVPQWPYKLNADVSGQLTRIAARWRLDVRETRVEATVRVTPFEAVLIEHLAASASGLNLKRYTQAAPETDLTVRFDGRGDEANTVHGALSVENRLPGTLDRQRLPLRELTARLTGSTAHMSLSRMSIDLGPAGRVQGDASLEKDHAVANIQVHNVDLRAIHRALRTTRLSGPLTASFADGVQTYSGELSQQGIKFSFDARQQEGILQVASFTARARAAEASGRATFQIAAPQAFSVNGALRNFNPAAFGDFPQAAINGTFDLQGKLQPGWRAALAYRLGRSTFRGYRLAGHGKLGIAPQRVHDADANLSLGRNTLNVRGAFGGSGDVLQVNLDAPALSALGKSWQGALQLSGRISGTRQQPAGTVSVQGKSLRLPGQYAAAKLSGRAQIRMDSDPDVQLDLQAEGIELTGQRIQNAKIDIAGSYAAHQVRMQARHAQADLALEARGAWDPDQRHWRGSLITLQSRGPYALKLLAPTPVRAAPGQLAFGPARIQFAGGAIDVGETRYDRGRLRSTGAFNGVPVATLIAYSKRKLPVRSTLTIGGAWRVDASEQLDAHVEVHRENGDLSVTAADRAFAIGLQQLNTTVDVVNGRATAQLQLEGSQTGRLTARAQTHISKRDANWGVWSNSPLALSGQAQIDSLKPLAALYGAAVDLDGRLAIDLQGKGTFATPRLRGRARATALRIEQVRTGLFLHDGSVQAVFDERGVELTEASIKAGEGTLSAKGRVFADDNGLFANLNWQADRLAAVQQPDLFLALTGAGRLSYQRERIAFSGALTVDRGRVELQPSNAPKLGDDVVVLGQTETGRTARLSPALDVTVDLGKDFLVQGRGLDARVEGKLALRSPGNAPITANGEIRVATGTYEAYGRKLAIERGTLAFNGPLDNPSLDIRAMRKNQQVEAGVEVRGTAQAPQVRLVSNPEVPDTEKLAWLVLGRPVAANNPTDSQALQRSAALILADLGISPLQKQVAKELRLDELSVSPGTGNGGVVTIAKRLSDRIYVMFEQSLTAAGNALKVNYQLSQRWSVRTESGTTDAVDLFYSFSFD